VSSAAPALASESGQVMSRHVDVPDIVPSDLGGAMVTNSLRTLFRNQGLTVLGLDVHQRRGSTLTQWKNRVRK